jgi:glycosyltransferase involved in cell wall biosynthesis
MKIALVVHDFDPSVGQGCYAVELAQRLKIQHEVHIVASSFGKVPPEGLHFREVPLWRGNTLLKVFSFIRGAERICQREHFEIVHAQGLSNWRANVITAHICNAARRKLAPSPDWKNRLFQRLVEPWERRFYHQRAPSHLIAVSQRVASEIKLEYGWNQPATVIYHGVDADRFRPAPDPGVRAAARAHFQLEARAWVWLFVGEAIKGLSQAIDQLVAFPDAQLLVISRSQPGPFRTHAESLGVGGRVRFHGPEKNMPLAYQAADVLVYPSAYDAFALVVAEAMAAGLPVIVGQDIGAAEWIQSEHNGLWCDPARPATLLDRLRWLRQDGARAAALGSAGRATAEKHTWDACASETEAVYQQVNQLRPRSKSG